MAFHKKITAYITASSVTDIYYIIQKLKNKREALNSNFTDFEDAVINFSAVNSNIEIIVTRNISDYKNSKLKILEQKQFIKYFEQRIKK